MSAKKNRQWMVVAEPNGAPVLGRDIKLVENDIPSPDLPGSFLVRVLTLSLDPYQRGTMNRISYGRKQPYPRLMTAGAVGQIVKSNNLKFPVGRLVQGQFGWQDYAAVSKRAARQVRLLPALESIPSAVRVSYYVGVLGMPGATAYFGLLNICNPQPGETVVVSSATGAVGQVVGQIAKLKGCKVIGFASTKEKCDFARDIGYDAAIIYRGKTVPQLIKEITKAAPGGVNCYFDNSGGPCTEATLYCLAQNSRVSVCGQIAYYNLKNPLGAKSFPATMIALTKQARIEGFMVNQFPNHEVAFAELEKWIVEGKIQIKEDETTGLENAFSALLNLFHDIPKSAGEQGKTNFGKKLVKVADPKIQAAL